MKKILLLSVSMIMLSFYVRSQDLNITFAADDGTTTIDEVVAKNLTTDESVTLPGTETLVLHSTATNIKELSVTGDINTVPNPYFDKANLYFSCSNEVEAAIQLMTPNGVVVVSKKMVLTAGSHNFKISGSSPGFYIVSVITDKGIKSTKVVQKINGNSSIEYAGTEHETESGSKNRLKVSNATYELDYSPGDVISYTIKSGDNITIVNEKPSESKVIAAAIVTCKDHDNNNYKTVKIGDQIWMAENLKTTHYANGDAIPYVASDADWKALSDDYHDQDRAYCFNSDYGCLYTWAGAMNGANSSVANPSGVQGACPDGWHLPSPEEFIQLNNFLGGGNLSTYKLKEVGYTWGDNSNPKTIGSNESGFSGKPAGFRDPDDGTYGYVGSWAFWWATNGYNNHYSAATWYIYLNWDFEGGDVHKSRGSSVRCVMD